jgi:uncharacterized membrane protein
MMTNAAITAQARATLKGSWKMPILAFVVYFFIFMFLSFIPMIGWLASMIIAGPMMLGYCIFFLAFVRGEEIQLSRLFDGFQQFINALLAYILQAVFIFLWTLLLIIPGIIAAFRYAMTFYILADNPGMEGLTAITHSKELMMGKKWKLFCLGCRFIGWFLLGVLSLGIGFLWIIPYFQTSVTIFYEDLKGGAAVTGSKPQTQPQPVTPTAV